MTAIWTIIPTPEEGTGGGGGIVPRLSFLSEKTDLPVCVHDPSEGPQLGKLLP